MSGLKFSKVRIELERSGIGELLKSSGVQGDLERRAEGVAAAAVSRGITVEGDPGEEDVPIEVFSSSSGSRARARVVTAHPAGVAIEAKHRLLVGSLDAARY